jgi:putative protease
MSQLRAPELVCPAGTPAALRTAVDAGADAVYCGLQNETNARNFPGLNFTPSELQQGIAYAHARKAKVLLAINTFPPAGRTAMWREAVDLAATVGADAVIVADMGVADYAARAHPDLRLHLSVQAGASSPEAIRFYCEEFGVKRVVLPRMLTVSEIADLHRQIPCEIEAFIFGNIGMMAEGRCSLTHYVTGVSTNMDGVCSPAADVHYEEDADRTLNTRLGAFVIDRFACGESAGYPTICKGRYLSPVRNEAYYAFEEPVTLNLSALLPDLMRSGVTALKIEGRQRSRAYVKSVVGAFRQAVDGLMQGRDAAFLSLLALTEGSRETQGAFAGKTWR